MDIGVILTVLWPYMAALYVLDCFLVVRGGHLLFSGTTFSGFRTRGAGLRLTGLLPWDWSILSVRETLIFSEIGLYVRTVPFPDDLRPPGPDDLELILYEEIGNVSREGRKVLVDGRVVHTAPTGVAARLLAGRVRMILNTPAGDRREVVDTVMAGATDLQAIRDTVEGIKRSTNLLMNASALLFVLLFVLIPVSLLVRLPLSWLWGEVVLLAVVCLSVIVLWWRAHGTLLPGESADRMEELLVFVLFPVSALHAFGKLTRRVLTPFESVALTVALDPDAAEKVLKREYIRARAAAGSGGGEDLESAWDMRTRILDKLAQEVEVDLDRLEVPTDSTGDAEGPACPLCSATYREGFEVCADCGIHLVEHQAADKGGHQ